MFAPRHLIRSVRPARSCRGPRWAETRLHPTRKQSSSGRVGRGLARSESGRSGHRGLCGRLLSAAPRQCAEESCREPAESGRSGRIQAPVSRSAKPLPTLPPATNHPRDTRRAAPGHSAAGTRDRHSGASGFDVNRWASVSGRLAVRAGCRRRVKPGSRPARKRTVALAMNRSASPSQLRASLDRSSPYTPASTRTCAAALRASAPRL